MPTNFKRAAPEDKVEAGLAKKPRLDSSLTGRESSIAGEIKKRLADKLDSSQEGGKLSINKANLK